MEASMKNSLRKILSMICAVAMLMLALTSIIPASAAEPKCYPVGAWYDPDVKDDGFAAGTLTVRANGWWDSSTYPIDAVAYWANEDGPLEGYSALARFSLMTISSSYRFPSLQIIPEGADRIRVYTANKNDNTLSTQYVEAMLGETETFKVKGEPLHTFAVVSDTHVVNDDNHDWTKKFKNMLKDVSENIGVEGVFINGDMVNTASGSSTTPDKASGEYAKLQSIKSEVCPDMPIYMAIGNHDLWPVGFNNTSFQTMEQMFCQNTMLPDGSHPSSFFYDFWIDNNHFVFVGDSGRDPNYLWLNETALNWLDTTIASGYDEGKNTFIFMHQSIPNTVAGSLTDFSQGDATVENAYEIRQILKKYPDAMMFSSHSHYDLDSVGNAYNADPNYPTVFNTSSVANPYSARKGAVTGGSEGYIMEIYDDFILLKGRDFTNGLWKASSQYVVMLADEESEEGEGNNEVGGENPDGDKTPEEENKEPEQKPTENVTEKSTDKPTENVTEKATDKPTELAEPTDIVAKKSGCSSAISATATVLVLSVSSGLVLLSYKGKRED